MDIILLRPLAVTILLVTAIPAQLSGQNEFHTERALVEWELPEPPGLIYSTLEQRTAVLRAAVLPSGRVSAVTFEEKFWNPNLSRHWPEVERRYRRCIQGWRFSTGEQVSIVSITLVYTPLPRGSAPSELGVSLENGATFTIRYEALVPYSSHGTEPEGFSRLTSNCGR